MNHIPNLGRAWRRTFWTSYDHLGLMVILSLIWLICFFTVILMPAATTSLFRVSYMIIHYKKVKLKDSFCLLIKYFAVSTSVVLTFILLFFLLLLNIKFYLSHLGIIGIILAGISFWIFILGLLMCIYIFPLMSIGKGYKETFKYSLLLVLNNLKFSLKSIFCLVILLALEVLFPIIGIGIIAIFSQEALIELQARYDPDIIIKDSRRTFKEILKPWEFS